MFMIFLRCPTPPKPDTKNNYRKLIDVTFTLNITNDAKIPNLRQQIKPTNQEKAGQRRCIANNDHLTDAKEVRLARSSSNSLIP
jgi:hypothetical protein